MFKVKDKVRYKGKQNGMVARVWRVSDKSVGIKLKNNVYLNFSVEDAVEKLEKIGVFDV